MKIKLTEEEKDLQRKIRFHLNLYCSACKPTGIRYGVELCEKGRALIPAYDAILAKLGIG